MTTLQNKALHAGLILIALFSLIGCGSSKTNGEADSTAAASTATTAAQAICSQNAVQTSDLQVRLMQYSDSYGQTRADYTRLQFKIAPAAWQTGNFDMLIYRWTSAPDNSVSLDSTPLFYQFEKKVPAGFQLISNLSYQIFNWTEIQQMAQFAKVSATSPQDFFNTISLLVNVRDTSNSYQVLRVVFRQNGTVMQSTDVLIPTYQADPAAYNADSRHSVSLQALHPLKDKLGQNWSPSNYYEFAKAFCF